MLLDIVNVYLLQKAYKTPGETRTAVGVIYSYWKTKISHQHKIRMLRLFTRQSWFKYKVATFGVISTGLQICILQLYFGAQEYMSYWV